MSPGAGTGGGPRDIDLLVVGDVNPDIVVSDADPRPAFGQAERIVEGIRLTIGGSATLVACAASRLGLRVALVGAVGDDPLGRLTLDAVAARGVDVAGCHVLAGVPTGATVILAGGDDRAILTATGAIASVRAEDVPAPLIPRARHVHVASFFLQPALGPGLPALFRSAHEAGATTSLDPNFDPSGRWDGGFAAAAVKADVLLPNAAEACALTGVDDPRRAAWVLATRGGTRTVAVKLGAGGAAGVRGDGPAVEVAAPSVDVVDTVGAGDTFDAGFIAGWLDGRDLEGCLRLAVACGALSTRAVGGVEGQPTREEAEALARLSPVR
jgi:sugar/nucleoside kinase (ribokinase family)